MEGSVVVCGSNLLRRLRVNPEHPSLNPETLLHESWHQCYGAECPRCHVPPVWRVTVTANTPPTFPSPDQRRKLLESFRRAPWQRLRYVPDQHDLGSLAMCQRLQLGRFRDSRGLPVAQWPQRVLPSTTAIIVHGAHWQEGIPWQVLVHQRSDNAHWGFPGGAMETGESLEQCLVREVKEETGLTVYVHGLTSIDSDPTQHAICTYPNGDTVQYVNHTFLCGIVTGTLQASAESTQLQFLGTDQLPEPFLPAHAWRLAMAMRWTETKQVALR